MLFDALCPGFWNRKRKKTRSLFFVFLLKSRSVSGAFFFCQTETGNVGRFRSVFFLFLLLIVKNRKQKCQFWVGGEKKKTTSGSRSTSVCLTCILVSCHRYISALVVLCVWDAICTLSLFRYFCNHGESGYTCSRWSLHSAGWVSYRRLQSV